MSMTTAQREAEAKETAARIAAIVRAHQRNDFNSAYFRGFGHGLGLSVTLLTIVLFIRWLGW